VDASFALKLVLPEENRERVRDLWAGWLRDGVTVVAPWLLAFETHAVLRRKVVRGELTDREGLEAWRILRRQGIETVHPRSLFDRAWAISRLLSRPTTYDAVYMATAELRGCELWTADYHLINAASNRFAWMRAV
jgi:predicted nucleic acid-binding protein